MDFNSHTRGNSPTKNKPQVFLLAAPENEAVQTELIRLLLDYEHGANLCVWSSDAFPEKKEIEKLEGMNLFVLAVTEELASAHAAEAAQIIRLAYQKKIPVLPVYYISPSSSSEPAGSFYRTVKSVVLGEEGKLELDGPRYAAKDFEEQFYRKLHALVIADEVTEEIIRDAFHRQIFLSYRKKDREQALKVMKAIHSLPWCEALAIWFDDFLIAGQDYNQEIQHQLQTSDAFALAVTSHISEKDKNGENNYVLREEWPRAVALKSEKNRILVEAEQTDPKDLCEIDPPMKRPTPVWDEDALREAIGSSCLLDGERKKPSARQKYLLGMAYLTGIRVEKDEVRAVRLLTEAANEGCADSALQLGFMYLARVGVERDNDLAREWKERAFELAESRLPEMETAWKAAFGDDGLVLIEFASDRQDKAREICRRMRKLLERSPESDRRSVRIAKTWLEESQIHFDKPATLSQETLAMRREGAEQGLKILNALPALDDEGQHQLASGYGLLGDISLWQGQGKESETAYLHGLRIMETLVERTESVVYRRVLAGFWNSLGALYEKRFMPDKAQEAYAAAVPLCEALYAERGLPNDAESLAIAYYNYGKFHPDAGEGAEMMQKAVALMQKVVEEDPQDPYPREELNAMQDGLKKQRRKPLMMKLLKWGIILILGGALISGLISLVREILA